MSATDVAGDGRHPAGSAVEPLQSQARSEWRDGVSLLVRLGLGGVLVVAGWLKAVDPVQSALAVEAYKILPTDIAVIVGHTMPWAEIAIGLLLVVGLATRWAAIAAAVLMVVFIAGVISAWVRGLAIDCGCFGGGGDIDPEQTAYPQEILRDTIYLAGAAWLVYHPRSWWSLDRWRSMDLADDAPVASDSASFAA